MPILSTLAFLGFCFALTDRLKIAFSTGLLLAPVVIILALYIGALLGLLLQFTVVLLALGVLLLGYFALHQRAKEPGFPATPLLLFVLALVFWLIHRESAFAYYDEYSHWGVYLRDMLAKDGFWGADSNAWHLRNLPAATLWQYFFARFSDWPEGAAFLAQFLLVFAPLMVLFERIRTRQAIWILGVFGLLALAVLNFGHGFVSIYVDHVIGAWFAGVLLALMYEFGRQDRPPTWIFALPLAMLAFLKSQGFFFMLAAAGITGVLLLMLTLEQGNRPGRALLAAAVAPCLAVMLSVVLMTSWDLNRDHGDIPAYRGSTSNIANSLVRQDSVFSKEQKAEIARRFFEVLSSQQISKDAVSARFNAFSYPVMRYYTDRFRLTTFTFLLVSGAAVLLTWRFLRTASGRREWLLVGGLTWLTTVAYIAVLFLGYRYIANDQNGFNLSSFMRYSHSMLMPMLIIAFAPLVPAFQPANPDTIRLTSKLELSKSAVVFTIAIAALYVFETPYPKNALTTQTAPAFRLQTEIPTARLRQTIGTAPLWVFFPNDVSSGMIGHVLQFQLSPGRAYVEEDLGALLEDPLSLKDTLAGYDYAWFPLQSADIDAAIATLVEGEATARVFRILHEDGGIRLEPAPEVFAN